MSNRIAVVIPAYKVRSNISDVIDKIPGIVDLIIVVDDACPENSGIHVEQVSLDPRLQVKYNAANYGVGGAMLAGYQAAIDAGATIACKVDGDGQMNPSLISTLVEPIFRGEADYVKGNRFFFLESLKEMPAIRLVGNAVLSLVSKFSTGYWHIMDPTNGFTAIHLSLIPYLETNKINQRYFFETDMLFRLGLIRAVARDMPMDARYRNETSHLNIFSASFTFTARHLQNFIKRIFYHYYLRDFSAGTVQLTSGILLLSLGATFGGIHWIKSIQVGIEASAGTVMIAGLPVLAGIQLLIGALHWDIASTPQKPIHPILIKKLQNDQLWKN